MTEKPRRTYSNAGAQTQLAYRELIRYGGGTDEDLLPVKTVSIILGINRNKVVQIPVARRLIDKRAYYRRCDVCAWVEVDLQQPESLLAKLREEQAKAIERMRKQPSRYYDQAELSKEEAKAAKAKTRSNVGRPFSKDEVAAGWGRSDGVLRRNRPVSPPKKITVEEEALLAASSELLRCLLNSK